MNAKQLLRVLHQYGMDSSADYNDGLGGWFSWEISDFGDLMLTVTFADENGSMVDEVSWFLVDEMVPSKG